MPGLEKDTLLAALAALDEFARRWLPDSKLLELDAKDEFPEEIVRRMCGPELGIQLFFLPEELHGMGAGSFDLYRLCERMGRIDVGVATALFATFLGSEPLFVGGTAEQKQRWLTRIADEGILVAYGATEPAAGSDLSLLRTTAARVEKDGRVVAYRLDGAKQWISNGGYASFLTILANAPGGPSWFVVERGTPGFTAGKPEDKHGIRLSNTAALSLDGVEVPADHLVGLVEGQGLNQAQAVFGYTRLMVAAFALGAGWSALDKAMAYSLTRIQGGAPLAEKQGYTHKLIVPHAVRLEAARAVVEECSTRLDLGEKNLNSEGAIAKYLASEAAVAAADAAIQALGGYGYTREYMVEKIRRDARITTIYEGTSEILEMTVGRDFWQQHLKTRGMVFKEEARSLRALPEHSGGAIAALALESLGETFERARLARLTRHQHVLLRLGELVSLAEGAAALARRAAATLPEKGDRRLTPDALAAASRIYAREVALAAVKGGLQWLADSAGAELATVLRLPEIQRAQAGLIGDMNAVADALYGRRAAEKAA
ncbi:MAG TPA: acyl-CoA dehydrogenase family protein [Myxococcales bacterium]|nr:acyl-CoA dehydrogenase family protein [Myxococcales bacterium]